MEVERFPCVFVLLVLVLFFAAPEIHGQAAANFRLQQDAASSARYKIGPFSLVPSLRFNIGYDNNIYRRPYPEHAAGDFIIRAGAALNVHFLYGDWLILSMAASPVYVVYPRTEAHKNWDTSFSPRIQMLLLERFVLSGSYIKSKTWRRPTYEFDVPTYEKQKSYNVSLAYDPARRVSFTFSFSEGETRHDEKIYAGRLDRRFRRGNVGINYGIMQGTYFFISGNYAEFKFLNPSATNRDGISYGVHSGINFPLIARMIGRLSIGYGNYEPHDKTQQGYSGWLGDTSLQYSMGRFRLRLQYTRNMQFSISAQSFFINENIGSGVSVYLDPIPFRLGYDFSYGTAGYPDGNRNIYRNHSARAVLRLINNIGLGLNLTRWERLIMGAPSSQTNNALFVYLDYAYRF